MSFFTSTRSNITKTPLNSSVDRASAIALLHDHNAFIDSQPLVVSKEVIKSPPSTDWIVTEANAVTPPGVEPEFRSITVRVPFGPFGSSDVTTTSAYVDVEGGSIIVFQAPIGLYGKNEWTVVPAVDGQGFVLVEEVTMTGFAPLMPFIVSTEKQSHTELGLKLAQKLAEGK